MPSTAAVTWRKEKPQQLRWRAPLFENGQELLTHSPMPTITIDGQSVNVPAGTTIIQAAEKLGIYIPRYCYHPGLPVAGSCRMCLVEVEKLPKLQIACHTAATDGMNVITTSAPVQQARRAMLEFLLINHPLDCPVCDQSGECDLQNFYMEFGQYDSHFLENKIKKKKAYPIGPHVILDQERCILCTRCTRFCEHVTKTHELGVFQRGNRSVIDLHPGKVLDNQYSGNVIDICPVGALLERDFRFQCRVWYLGTQESICTGCARGCNTSIHFNQLRPGGRMGRRVYRLKPRFNPYVNKWWLCDEGRFGYRFIDEDRIEAPQLRRQGRVAGTGWKSVLDEVSNAIKSALEKFGSSSIGVIASPQLSNEELYLIQKIFVELMGVENIGFSNPWEQHGYQDDFLVRADKNPNTRGAELAGLNGDVRAILEKTASGEIKVLYVFRHGFSNPGARDALKKAGYLIFQGTNWNASAAEAHAVLAAATHAEKDGTFTNFEGRIQRFKQALLPLEDSRPDVEILIDLARRLGYPLVYLTPEDLFMEWRGKSYDDLGAFGEPVEVTAAPV
ncbi:MAG: (2Fe-2S)-binding protein [Acidobacteria bacterium]|nr:(2Fe-2S)-binding protein [Acidobacteriota bacterium]